MIMEWKTKKSCMKWRLMMLLSVVITKMMMMMIQPNQSQTWMLKDFELLSSPSSFWVRQVCYKSEVLSRSKQLQHYICANAAQERVQCTRLSYARYSLCCDPRTTENLCSC